MRLIKKKQTGYKVTGNIAIDMTAACIDHYRRRGKKIAYIRLEKCKWILFCAFIKEKIPMYDFSDGIVNFDGVEVTEGSTLQVTALYAEMFKEKVN
jgi:hypothetical protein